MVHEHLKNSMRPFLLVTVIASVIVDITEGAAIGKPLILTPYITSGNVAEARKDARTSGDFESKESYSGYLTVNASTGTNLFFWYFKAETAPENAPVILWLQGGPGGPSMFGAFFEHGPYAIFPNLTMKRREDFYYWPKLFHVLYIDNPSGTGYSFTNLFDYAKNECDVGSDLYEALLQFFKLFPELSTNGFYVTGESYAGKYVPAVAHYIHLRNPLASVKINLKGIAIGNGIIDPLSQVNVGAHLYQLGLIDDNALADYNQQADGILESIKLGNYEYATSKYFDLWDKVNTVTGFGNLFNLLDNRVDNSLDVLTKFMNQQHVRDSLNVGNKPFNRGHQVASYLNDDRMRSVKNWFTRILEHYDVLLYNGQLDLVRPYASTINFLDQLEWSGSSAYKVAPRNFWRVDNDIAGYSKTVFHKKNDRYIEFTEVLVRNAGHMVPRDQPKWAMDLMARFTKTSVCYPRAAPEIEKID